MRHFKTILLGFLLTSYFNSGCCYRKEISKNKFQKHELTSADSIWIQFSKAIESKNIIFLRAHSFDTIRCVDCATDSNDTTEYFPSEYIYQNYLDRLYNSNLLSNHEYEVYQDDTTIHISYSIKNKFAEEGREGIVYTFRKKDNKFLFEGLTTIP